MTNASALTSDNGKLGTGVTFVAYGLVHALTTAIAGSVQVADSIGSIFLLPCGLLFGALLYADRKRWAAIVIAALLAHLALALMADKSAIRAAIFEGSVVVIAALTGAAIMRWRGVRRSSLSTLINMTLFLLPAAIVSALCAAFLAAAGLAAFSADSRVAADSMRWFAATYLGIIAVSPCVYGILLIGADRSRWPSTTTLLTGATLLGALVAVCYFVFGKPLVLPGQALQLPIVLLPFLVTAVFAFGAEFVALCIALIATIAVIGSLQGFGRFALGPVTDFQDYGPLQVFLIVSAFVSLILAAAVNEWRAAKVRWLATVKHYRAYVENSLDAIWCLELEQPMPVSMAPADQVRWIMDNARIAELNDVTRSLLESFGVPEEPPIGLVLSEQQILPQDEIRSNVEKFVASGYEIRGVRTHGSLPDGRERVIESNFVGHVEDALLQRIWGTNRDITERLAAKAQLDQTEERFSKVFRSTPISVSLTDLDSLVYIDVNPGFERLHGYSRDEVVGKSSIELQIWKDPDLRQNLIERVRREGNVHDVDIEFRTKTGRCHHGLFSAEVFKLGNRTVVVSNIQDVTELRLTEKALRQSEERFFKTFNNNPDPVVISNAQTDQYIDVNEAFEEFSGYRRDELIGRTSLELGRWADIQQRERLHELMLKNGSVSNVEVEFRTRSGESQVAMISCERVEMNDESCVISTLRDLTEQRRAESALVKSRELIAKAFRNSPDAIIISEISGGRVLEVNDAFLAMTGFSRDEVIDKPAAEVGFWKDIAQRTTVIDALRQEGRLSQIEVDFTGRDGHDIAVSFSGELIEIDGKVCVVSVSRDITERKSMDEMLHAYQQRLRSLASKLTLAEEEVRRQTAVELHDGLCQDLAAMIMRLGVHRGSLEKREQIQSVDDVLDVLKSAMRAARAIVNDLSQQQMFERGLSPAIRSLGENFAERSGFEFSLQVDRQPKPMAESVKIVLFRSVRELLANVSAHADANQVVARIAKQGDDVVITITDDGVGFDVAQADGDLDVDSGFGLFGIRQQIEWLGGSVDIQSQKGSGATVAITAPLDYSFTAQDELLEFQ